MDQSRRLQSTPCLARGSPFGGACRPRAVRPADRRWTRPVDPQPGVTDSQAGAMILVTSPARVEMASSASTIWITSPLVTTDPAIRAGGSTVRTMSAPCSNRARASRTEAGTYLLRGTTIHIASRGGVEVTGEDVGTIGCRAQLTAPPSCSPAFLRNLLQLARFIRPSSSTHVAFLHSGLRESLNRHGQSEAGPLYSLVFPASRFLTFAGVYYRISNRR